jgi:hypothetical protein
MSEKKIVLDVIKDSATGRMRAVLPDLKVFGNTSLANGTGGYNPPTSTGDENTIVPLPREDTDGWRWANWGSNDRQPTDIRTKIMQSPMASSTVYKLIRMSYGNGLAYYKNSDRAKAKGGKIERAYVPQVEEWLEENRIPTKFLQPKIADFRFNMNVFSEMILNRRRDFITGLYHKTAEFSRLSKQNEETMMIDWLYYSSHFPTNQAHADNMKRIRLLPWWKTNQFIEQYSRDYKFAWHGRFETPGIKYYARPYWLGLFRKNGWIDASIAVPEIVNAMMRNQVVLLYQISIPESYYEIRHHGKWDSYTADEREVIIEKHIDLINQELSGIENNYKSISTVFRENEINGSPEGKIEILAIDDKVKKDSWVPTSDVADAQVVQGFGLHPSQMGLGNGGKSMGAGSGSDQREGYNTEISTNTIEQDVILEDLNWVARFNAKAYAEWGITFFMDHTFHTTTNNQESGLQPSPTSLIPE